MVKTTDEFLSEMKRHIELKNKIYGNSWKEETKQFLERRIQNKWEEYQLTKNPNKLISLANLSMLLHLKMENEE